MGSASSTGDPVAASLRAFDIAIRARMRGLVTPELIEEHARAPEGPHSRELSAVLNYLRRAPMAGKLAIYAEEPFALYRVVRLSGRRGEAPVFASTEGHATIAAASHAIFLMRIAELMETDR
ncbi:hypothetical protein [Propylenella binzhouense]|uniref:N,N-dimethylformamidase alpha subunit domain-containing protein n=1 Tax=Propylenella binzhouense TaxID=2555902 RepID=A0A964WRX0_9HYPH|nr:hypothetical protein [Propylenella binzhouense]MYZ46235.1 hypothetical protein [Propylenella binzhouense]